MGGMRGREEPPKREATKPQREELRQASQSVERNEIFGRVKRLKKRLIQVTQPRFGGRHRRSSEFVNIQRFGVGDLRGRIRNKNKS